MDKAFIKRVFSIIKEIDSENYINNVKYVIFFISKIAFMCKSFDFKIIDAEYSNYHNYVLNIEDMGIFNEYSKYNLNDINAENKIYELIYDYKTYFTDTIFEPGRLYEALLTSKEKKSLGQVYTPSNIIESMLSQTFKAKEINEETKILDPSCGGGYFLIEAFKKIRQLHQNYQEISESYIIENMLYGIDIDDFSIFLTKAGLLFNSSNCTNVNFNIYKMDFLTESKSLSLQFDIIIGNPPYIGHKNTDKSYRALINEEYKDVYYDKSDISYCFFKRGKEMLKPDGVLCYITSRYFMEAMFADKLRHFIKNSFDIISVEDYYGSKVFKNAMISPVIITLSNITGNKTSFAYVKYYKDLKIETFNYDKNKLSDKGWIILSSKEEDLFNRIDSISNTYIKDICSIKQGIITGLDSAFIVTEKEIEKYNLEKFYIKKWIKNSDIAKHNIRYKNLYVIYSNLINDESECPNIINYLKPFKARLLNRRECKYGYRKWYELQWGRNISDLEKNKIIFPYKSSSNNFYYDTYGYFCSADVYFINELYKDITFEFLHKYLNSKVFEFYFKCHAKKVGIDTFEYYPNKLNNIKIFLPQDKLQQNISDLGKISIDNYLKKVFNIDDEEENAIIYKFINQEGDDAI